MEYLSKLDHIAAKIADNSLIRAVRKGMLYLIPLTLIGSLSLLLLNLPIPAFQSGMDRIFGEHWRTTGLYIYNATFQIMSITALLAVAYCYSAESELVKSGEVNKLSVLLTAIASYIAFCGASDTVINFKESSSTGLFQALLIAAGSTRLFLWLYSKGLARSHIISNDIDVVLRASLHTVLPAFLTVLVIALIRTSINLLGIGLYASNLYEYIIQASAQDGQRFVTVFPFILASHLLWFLGFHGTNLLDGVANELYVTARDINVSLYQAGQAPTEIFTKEFFDIFVYMGGCGATLGLLFASMIANRKRFNRLERYSLLPAIFNINEMLVYGFPIIFNPYLLIPFLAAPILTAITSFTAMQLGLVPLTISQVIWTTPIFISGYISTGSFAGTLLQLFNLTLSVLVYLPFVRLYQTHQSRNSAAIFRNLSDDIQYIQESRPKTMLTRGDEVGIHARFLAEDITASIKGEARFLHLEYQPKVDRQGRVAGAEALLRCTHPIYGKISPMVLLAIADEAEISNELGAWIIRTAIREQRRWNQLGFPTLSLSVNVSPQQLRTDPVLAGVVLNSIKQNEVDPRYLELELTENVAMDQSPSTHAKLEHIREAGIHISIDDFGMGHSSLLYLRDFHASVVKLDMSLVSSIAEDNHSQQIVASICNLCHQLHVGIVAEGTETLEQVEKLEELGCHIYQGWYYSPSLSPEDFIAYVREYGCVDLYKETAPLFAPESLPEIPENDPS